jgi:putative molybdopterin biosynthesis protein
VAVQIASGSADAGMGIYSAAKLYDLDFIPICIEEYDLLISDAAWNTPQVQQMIATMQSAEFKEKILAMGGYTLENPGQIISVE